MLISLNWLRDFVEIPSSITPEELDLRLTMHTVEIDGIEKQGKNLSGVVVGEILEIKNHPNADKLSVAQVNVGEKKPRQIIFGQMADMNVGFKIPMALAPTVLPSGMKIIKTKLRGEISEGMFCLDQELGLVKEAVSIRFFDKSIKNGISIVKALGLNDTIFEVDNKSITNRPDLWGHYGMAREISAFLKVKLKEQNVNLKSLKKDTGKKISVEVKNSELCQRYMAIEISGIKIAPSPEWIQKRLIAVGQKPINNIVDITNYVMLELGQPLHAFDKNSVDKIIVRTAKKGETVETLDGEKRELDKEILVIADGRKPIAIAGVIGGAESGITDKTESIILESANFNFLSIRKTSQKIGTRTESSMRFEKGLDPNLCEIAIARAVELIKQICQQAKIASALADKKQFNDSAKIIKLNLEWLDKKIGDDITEKKVVEILTSLGFKIKKNRNQKNILDVEIPSWRAGRDISIPEDLVEEIARIYGYDNLKLKMPRAEIKAPLIQQEQILERKIKNILAGAPALLEVYNYSFVGKDQLKKMGIDYSNYIRLANPISQNHTMLRQGLAANMIGSIIVNQARQKKIRLFEIGGIYINSDGSLDKDDKGEEKLPFQEKRVCLAVAVDKYADANDSAKAIIGNLLETFGFEFNFLSIETASNWAEQKTSAQIEVNKEVIGSINRVSKNVKNKIGLKKEAIICELSLNKLLDLINKKGDLKYKEIAKYPRLIRDLAFVINEKVLYN
ncbi:phenylalanine--tRNA ligase subunit beta, partial [Candidatus Parcubacteria bacterium]|nr:phenylalanine--tRNA ligase subunit beta [Candidatus Parcubacteria bacterium]